ncbi:MAG: TIGR02710 family CRISPR-associated CARF protein [Eubacteriales bacterium]|nr:TIGR02710 family CRISPR-associated CARF protein [Eubacteriales bacterium]
MKTKEKKSLQELTEIWKAMERKTLSQRKEAEKYYESHLMQPIVEDYKERNADLVFEQVDYLMLSVGTSYEPLVLNIALLSPKKILFLYTEKTEEILNKIVKYLKLKATDYQKSMVDATDSISVYQEIKRAYISWDKPQKVYIDFTGGTKAMSAAAALAGSMIDVQMVYVGTEHYLTDFRKPEPGSEELFYIDNPIQVFGDIEIEKVFALIERYNYAGAAERLKKLKDNIPDPLNRQQINFVYLLVSVYEHWDALEFEEAAVLMDQLLKELKRDFRVYKKLLMMDFQPILNNQYKILSQLNKIPALIRQKKQKDILSDKSIMISLMYTMYENALRREEQEKYDMATLLFYRLLEMIEQRRLITYDIFVSRPDYQQADFSKASPEYSGLEKNEQIQLLKTTNKGLKQQLFSSPNERDYLPNPIALLDGYLLLAALGDAVTAGKDGKAIYLLKRIRAMVSLRNNSIFAHGLGPVKEEDYYKFRDFVTEMFQEFCKTENIDFDLYKKTCRFLNPITSKYYKIMGENK